MIEEHVYSESNQRSIIVFEVGWEQFAIDLLEVKEIIQAGQIRKLPKSLDFIEGIYNYRGDIIHIINLKKKLNLNEYRLYKPNLSSTEMDDVNKETETEETKKTIEIDKTDDNSKMRFIIIVNINNTHVGFFVNRIIEVTHINPNDLIRLSPIFQTSVDIEYIKGVVKFKDRPRILIDFNKILSEAEQILIQKEKI
ncbi:MAG: chemotaxis protein CheW [Promethearchaeota archaeon]